MNKIGDYYFNKENNSFIEKIFNKKLDSHNQKPIKLNDKILLLLDFFQKKPFSTLRELAKFSNIPLTSVHRIYQQLIDSNFQIKGDLYPFKIKQDILISLEEGNIEGTIQTVNKIIIDSKQKNEAINELLTRSNQVWKINHITHRFSALTYQLLASEGYPYSLWGFLLQKFIKGERRASIFPDYPFIKKMNERKETKLFSDQRIFTILTDLKSAKKDKKLKQFTEELLQKKIIIPYLSLKIKKFTENALIIIDIKNKEMDRKITQALLELPFVSLYQGYNIENKQHTLLAWLNLEKGDVYRIQEQFSIFNLTRSVKIYAT